MVYRECTECVQCTRYLYSGWSIIGLTREQFLPRHWAATLGLFYYHSEAPPLHNTTDLDSRYHQPVSHKLYNKLEMIEKLEKLKLSNGRTRQSSTGFAWLIELLRNITIILAGCWLESVLYLEINFDKFCSSQSKHIDYHWVPLCLYFLSRVQSPVLLVILAIKTSSFLPEISRWGVRWPIRSYCLHPASEEKW